MKLRYSLLSVAAFLALSAAAPFSADARSVSVSSPSGRLKAVLDDGPADCPLLSVEMDGVGVLKPSPVGMKLRGRTRPLRVGASRSSQKRGERIVAPFHHTPEYTTGYDETSVALGDGLSIVLRAYDEGIAYRFVSAKKGETIVEDEIAEYRFPEGAQAWLPYSTNSANPTAMAFQNFYDETPISSAPDKLAFLPVAVAEGGLKTVVLESGIESYPGMFLKADSVENSLKGVFARYPDKFDYKPRRKQRYVTSTADYIARSEGARSYPWRILAVTDDDRSLPVSNIVYSLAEPSRVADTSWIKPGKVAWDWWNDWGLRGVDFKAGINTETYRHYIDFAAENGIEYVVLDEGWYEPKSGDMLTVIPDIDLPALVEYASEKGVGIVLWTVFNVLDDQLEEACRKYSELGVKGFKVDFLDRDDQEGVEMAWRIADACARHKMMLDYHGFYKPSGMNRTYPNIVNFEGVFGLEELKWSAPTVDMPRYDVTYPYIRQMSGPADYTQGAMRNASKKDWKAVYYNPMSQGTRAHQVATYVVFDSPFTMLCDSPSLYRANQSTTDFITSIPTVFESSEVVDGKMGEYIVTLRRDGDKWYVGGLTDWTPRDYELDFSFLPAGKSYKAKVFADGVNADKAADDYNISEITVDSTSRLPLRMASGGGFAIIITPSHGYPIDPVPFTQVKVSDGFWGQRLKACREVTIPLAFSKCEESGRYRNFVNATHPSDTIKVEGFSFDDTDVYKTIEGASYLLQTYPDKRLEQYIDSVLTLVAAAQEPDGYLYTSRTMNPAHPHEWAGASRWEKVEVLSHEFYNLGHMVEGAVAHYQATGKRNFLDIAIRYADCVCCEIGDGEGQVARVPGHQIAEMALAKLYLATGDRKYLDQAKYFLDKRGKTSRRDAYSQAHKPVIEQDEAVGHAVRAAYMYAGMADVAALTGDSSYIKAVDRIWDNMIGKKYYITGGIGSTSRGEAFGKNYELPNLTAYCETCAAIGNVYVNHRLFLLHGDSKYYDVVERTLYNGLISGMSIDGGAFFYPNPLESDGSHERQPWFGCACCPSNLSRFIPSVPGYVYAVRGNDIYVNLFMSNDAKLKVGGKDVALSQKTGYPWNGDIRVEIGKNHAGEFALKLRLPGWAKGNPVPSDLYSYADSRSLGHSVSVNGKGVDCELTSDGYLTLRRDWKKGDVINLHFDMEPRLVRAHEKVEADRGRLAVERGPLVYCAEFPDNDFEISSVLLNARPEFKVTERGDVLNGIVGISTEAQSFALDDKGRMKPGDVTLNLIPYYSWNHRGKGKMAVWLPTELFP